jgi:5-methyltetrahydrofolate corrinoid/iron sulfur protein methyltransferase
VTAPPIRIIGDQINNAYGRARHAWVARDPSGFQRLAVMQAELGAVAIDLNIDGNAKLSVRMAEMLDFLPIVIPAIQEATDVPICFDSPSVHYHRVALAALDRSRCRGKPIFNSLAASRTELDEMIDIVRDYDMRCIVMASERFLPEGGGAQCFNPQDSYATVLRFVEMLVTRAGRTIDDIIVDPGLAPVGADTYGLVNIGLDTMRLCSADPNLAGIHYSVGLTNFAWGTPKGVRDLLEQAYLTIGGEVGLDMAMANIERSPHPLPADHPMVQSLREALAGGRAVEGECAEDAGFRQASMIMDICRPYADE